MKKPKKQSIGWTKARQARVVRGSGGRFKEWKGGKSKAEIPKKRQNYHGGATHIGKEFARQHGRPAQVGEIVRKKTEKGDYHDGSYWYVRTKFGWRNTGKQVKPAPAELKYFLQHAREGRPA